jgi:hypothetical protein
VAEDPLRAVVRGTGKALKNIGRWSFLMTWFFIYDVWFRIYDLLDSGN